MCPFKVALEVFHDRVLRSLGRRWLMTSTEGLNTMAPQSALCICQRKWKTKLIVPIYFGTKTCKIGFKIISSLSLVSELSFDSEDCEINFARARSTTVNSRLSFESNLQATTGKTSLRTSGLYIRNGKLDMKWRKQENEKQERKLEDCFESVGWLFRQLRTQDSHAYL